MGGDELKKILHAVPFKPFTVYMPNDRAFEIPHSDFACLTPRGRTLIIASNQSEGVDILDVPRIARMEIKDAPQENALKRLDFRATGPAQLHFSLPQAALKTSDHSILSLMETTMRTTISSCL